jgi:transcription initiation factor TFIID subunit 5
MLLVACIINDRVTFSRVEVAPQVTGASKGLLLELVGYTPVSSVTRSQLPVLLLGVPGKGRGTGMAQMPAFLSDEVYREWLKNIILRNFFHNKAQGAPERSATRVNDGGHLGDSLTPSVMFATLTNAHDGMTCLNIDRAGERAVGGFQDSCVRVWSLSGKSWSSNAPDVSMTSLGNFQHVHPRLHQHIPPSSPRSGNTSSMGNALYTGSASNSSESDHQLPILQLRGHSAPVYGVSQEQVNTNGRLIVSCSGDRSIRLWDTNVRQTVGKYISAATPWDVQFGPLGYYFAAASADRSVSVYATDSATQVRVMFGHSSDASCVAWHPNASILLSGSDDKTVRLWDLRSGQCQRILRGCPSGISCMAVSPAGDRVAAGTDTGSVHIWDIGSGTSLCILQGHTGAVHSAAFSDSADAVVTGGADCSVRTWDMERVPAVSGSAKELAPQHATVPIQQPVRSLHTKFSPAFYVGYTPRNLVLAGGPFSPSSGSGEALQMDSRREEEVVAALGMAFARPA